MVETKSKKRVGVLRGGSGKHYKSSLQKGGEIISHIYERLGKKYKVMDILVDKDYVWHLGGLPINTSDLINKIDVVWNTTHPSFSNILDSLAIPNAGNKDYLLEKLKQFGVQMPRSVISPKSAREVFGKFGAPWIVKSSNEIRIVKTFDELSKIINDSDDVIVEEFILGKIASLHSVPGFRGQEIYIFPLGNSFGSFSDAEKERLNALVKDLHKNIGGGHYLKMDFVLNSKSKIYLLQITGIPDLKPDSHFSQVCGYVGAEPHTVIEHILERALERKA
ncbi:MAG: hypothetical protein PHT16_03605 [Candidatus Pacebacteria bacterium]|nr:hypothetical protein [Candidatus Paceibacterota bacterium]